MHPARTLAALANLSALALSVALVACNDPGRGAAGSPESTVPLDAPISPPSTTQPPPASDPATSATSASTVDVAPPAPTTAAPEVPTIVLGGIVGGSAGGIGEGSTDSFSEVVREEDGSCSGWDGRLDGESWTAHVTAGAIVTVSDAATAEILGRGVLGPGGAQNESLGDDEQWQCWFPFEVVVSRGAAQYAVTVDDQKTWIAQENPLRPGELAVAIPTPVSASLLGACAPGQEPPTQVGSWRSVGQFWSNGLGSICAAGLVVDEGAVKRPCSPTGIASDHVISVVDAANPTLVYEDTSGVVVDTATILPGTAVVVNVASGIPCE